MELKMSLPSSPSSGPRPPMHHAEKLDKVAKIGAFSGVMKQMRGGQPYVMARVCKLQVSRIEILHPLPGNPAFVRLSVFLSDANRRALESNSIPIPDSSYVLDVQTDLNFSLHYQHHIKSSGLGSNSNSSSAGNVVSDSENISPSPAASHDILQVHLQTRSKTSRGFKTVATASTSLHEILQCPFNGVLSMVSSFGASASPAVAAQLHIKLESLTVDDWNARMAVGRSLRLSDHLLLISEHQKQRRRESSSVAAPPSSPPQSPTSIPAAGPVAPFKSPVPPLSASSSSSASLLPSAASSTPSSAASGSSSSVPLSPLLSHQLAKKAPLTERIKTRLSKGLPKISSLFNSNPGSQAASSSSSVLAAKKEAPMADQPRSLSLPTIIEPVLDISSLQHQISSLQQHFALLSAHAERIASSAAVAHQIRHNNAIKQPITSSSAAAAAASSSSSSSLLLHSHNPIVHPLSPALSSASVSSSPSSASSIDSVPLDDFKLDEQPERPQKRSSHRTLSSSVSSSPTSSPSHSPSVLPKSPSLEPHRTSYPFDPSSIPQEPLYRSQSLALPPPPPSPPPFPPSSPPPSHAAPQSLAQKPLHFLLPPAHRDLFDDDYEDDDGRLRHDIVDDAQQQHQQPPWPLSMEENQKPIVAFEHHYEEQNKPKASPIPLPTVVADQIERVIMSSSSLLPVLCLVNTLGRRGKKAAQALLRRDGLFSHCTICTNGSGDVHQVLDALFKQWDQWENDDDSGNDDDSQERAIKVLLVGSDSYVNDILRNYIQLMAERNRAFGKGISFVIIPIAHEQQNEIAKGIATQDHRYASCFFSNENSSVLSVLFSRRCSSSGDKPTASSVASASMLSSSFSVSSSHSIAETGSILDTQISKFLKKVSGTSLLKLHVSEAFISCFNGKNTTSQSSIPFLKSLQIGLSNEHSTIASSGSSVPAGSSQHVITPVSSSASSAPGSSNPGEAVVRSASIDSDNMNEQDSDSEQENEDPSLESLPELKMEYWVQDESESHKDSIKSSRFEYIAALKMPSSHLPTRVQTYSNSSSTSSLCKPIKSHEFTLCVLLRTQKAKEMKSKLTRLAPKVSGVISENRVSKLMLTCQSEKQGFSARIDDIIWHNVHFLTASPQWISNQVKQFPIAVSDS